MPITHDEARVTLARWQPILRLADWDIDLRMVTGEWRKSGDIKVDLDDRKAVLLLHAEHEQDLEETVVHELIHVRLYALDQMLSELLDAVFGTDPAESRRAFAETQFMRLLESTTEDIAKALLAASGRPDRLSFGRLEAEVAREVEPGATTSERLSAGGEQA